MGRTLTPEAEKLQAQFLPLLLPNRSASPEGQEEEICLSKGSR
ncbi:hypothetical protein RHECNPAF_850028 [Rhizobium etli CNPAF512]|nr:hypothetical protein RHECNPAF_850028 [Rhizobium etli CNPAF512]